MANQKNTIIIRVDFSSKIGLGHLMRCLVLANQFKQSRIIFASLHVKDKSLVTRHGFELISLKTSDIEEFILLTKKLEPSLVIIDNYDINHKDEKKLKKNTKTKLMVLDDTYKKHFADVLLNHNIYAKKKHYKHKVPNFCKVQCGANYTLLRDEFKKEKVRKREKNGLLIALGGSDSQNLSKKIVKKIPSNIHVNLITSSANKNLDKLIIYAKKHKNINLHVNTNKMAKLMKKAKFAIITPSVLANEALYLGLDFMTIKTATNQKLMYDYLKNKGYYCIDSLSKFKFKKIERYL